jgi:hypothetical protein
MIVLDQVGCVHVFWSDPFIVTFGKSFPLDQVLKCSISPEVPVIDNFFDLLLFFSINYVWQGPGEVGPMTCGLTVGKEQ